MRLRVQGPSLFTRLAQVPPGAAENTTPPRIKPIMRRRPKDGHHVHTDRKTGRFVKSSS
jgi:hypothetical protein